MKDKQTTVNLPYIDEILSKIDSQDENYERAFMQNIHFGYWSELRNSEISAIEDYEKGTSSLTEEIMKLARVETKQEILDIGCGFGGTVNALNQVLSNKKIVGVNIDERQLQVAQKNYGQGIRGNQISFVAADAQKMPFADESFDLALAIECIFHMPDRNQFLKEAFRVLKPGGTMIITEIVLDNRNPLKLAANMLKNIPALLTYKKNIGTLGAPGTMSSYEKLAKKNGFEIENIENWSRNILPTFSLLKTLKSNADTNSLYSPKLLSFGEEMIRNGTQQYLVYVLKKPSL